MIVALADEALADEALALGDETRDDALFLFLRGEEARIDLCSELEPSSLTGGGNSVLLRGPLSLGGDTGLS